MTCETSRTNTCAYFCHSTRIERGNFVQSGSAVRILFQHRQSKEWTAWILDTGHIRDTLYFDSRNFTSNLFQVFVQIVCNWPPSWLTFQNTRKTKQALETDNNALDMVISFKTYHKMLKKLSLFAVIAEINFKLSTKMAPIGRL